MVQKLFGLVIVLGLLIAGQPGATPSSAGGVGARSLPYTVVDTGQDACYDDSGAEMPCPPQGAAFYGQDAQYDGPQPSYTDNGDGTVTDNSAGLMWQQAVSEKMTYDEALAAAETFDLAGYDDWRLPSIKELYSLIFFSGTDPSGCQYLWQCPDIVPFLDTNDFEFEYGDPGAGERLIDAQYWSSTEYVGTTMNGDYDPDQNQETCDWMTVP